MLAQQLLIDTARAADEGEDRLIALARPEDERLDDLLLVDAECLRRLGLAADFQKLPGQA